MGYEEKLLNICKQYNIIFIYVSTKDEPDTHKIIKELLKEKKVIVPKIKDNEIIPIVLKSFIDLKKGTFGILEPIANESIQKQDIDLFIISGVHFDLKGNRKGHGFGYFDRFLKDVKAKKIGLCFNSQIKELSPKPWDIPVDEVIIVDE